MVQTKWSETETEQILGLTGQGKTLSQIAKTMKRTKDSVRHKLKLLKRDAPPVPTTIKEVEKEEKRQEQEATLQPKEKPREKKAKIVYHSAVEWCPVHHCLVSNWPEHVKRLGGCSRPAA